MNKTQPGEIFEIPEAYALPYNFIAILKLAFSTAVFIATLLSIPNAVAIYPSTPDAGHMVVRVIGLWLSVFIQWQFSFLGILLILSFVSGPIIVDSRGIKLWRFGKIVSFDKIEGITCERASIIFRFLPFYRSASRLTIFIDSGKRLTVRNLDSLFFTDYEFSCLFQLLTLKSFDLSADSQRVFLFKPESRLPFASGHKRMSLRRGVVSSYIFIVLVLFLGSQTFKYYLYNASAIDMNQKNLESAKLKLEYATRIDNGFSIAWDRLARVNYRMKKFEQAEKCWRKAIAQKPDLVSAQVGLSSIYIVKSDFDKAETVLSSVIQANPRHIPALLNLAQVYFKRGKLESANKFLSRAMEVSGNNSTVCSAALSLKKRMYSDGVERK